MNESGGFGLRQGMTLDLLRFLVLFQLIEGIKVHRLTVAIPQTVHPSSRRLSLVRRFKIVLRIDKNVPFIRVRNTPLLSNCHHQKIFFVIVYFFFLRSFLLLFVAFSCLFLVGLTAFRDNGQPVAKCASICKFGSKS